jgi:tetratricopeptide (TPR) repeat protein
MRRTRSCIGALYPALTLGAALASGALAESMTLVDAAARPRVSATTAQSLTTTAQPAEDPDALYARRDDTASARRAADIWAARLAATPSDFESAWKLTRALYWLGTHGPRAQRRADLERGLAVARTVIALRPNAPEGHFWLAANMGALAESFGLAQGIKYRKPVRAALERVLAIDPAYQHGSADRGLGRWYYRVPGLFGGSNAKSVTHLLASLYYNPQSTASLYFLAETYVDMGKKDEARDALRRLADAPVSTDWGPEDREWKSRGAALMRSLEQRGR